MNPQRKPADEVAVRAGVKEAFFKRYRKDRARADAAWKSLVNKADALRGDTDFGDHFAPPRLPKWLQGHPSLFVIKGLPYGFRAVYSVFKDPRVGLIVSIEWVGDHDEYDKEFGYATS